MSRWLVCLVLVVAFGACGGTETGKHEPQTAKEKQIQEARASGELDKPSSKWAGWRYQGQRSECFYVLGRRCFKSEKAACSVAKCKAPTKCTSEGAGPATITCSK